MRWIKETLMDTWGIGILIFGIAVFFFTFKREDLKWWSRFGAFVAGLGAGIIIAALWAYSVVNKALESVF